jgi:hypothetical protein
VADGIDLDMGQVDVLAVALAESGTKIVAASEVVIASEAEAVRADAARRAPVLTGAQRAGYYVKDGGPIGKIVTNDVRESFYQELGTSRHGPQPALFPAADAGERRLVIRFEQVAGQVTL